MSLISTAKLAERTGYTKRQIQRLAAGGEVPGASRTPGGHWKIPEGSKLDAWVDLIHAARRSKMREGRKKVGHDNYIPHLTRLLTVLRKTVPGMNEHQRLALVQDTDQLVALLLSVRASVSGERSGKAATARSRASSW